MLSELPEGWKEQPLGEVTSLIARGIAPKYTDDEGIVVLNQKCVRDNKLNYAFARKHDLAAKKVNDEKLLIDGDVLVNSTGKGTLGRVAQFFDTSARKIVADSHLTIVRPLKEQFDKKYFGYACFWLEPGFEAEGTGSSGQTELSRVSVAENFSIAIPPLNEQNRIAEILSSVDGSIQATQAVIEQAERVKRGLMEELLTGGLGSEAIERGEVPEGWTKCSLGEVLALEYGKSLPEKTRIAGDYPVYGSAGIVGSHNEYLVESQSIVVGRKGTVGTIYKTSQPFFPIDTTYYVVPKNEINWDWLTALLESLQLAKLNEATGVPGLNRQRAYASEIFIPPLNEQCRIAEILNDSDSFISKQRETVGQLTRIKRGLMDDLLTGKVRTV